MNNSTTLESLCKIAKEAGEAIIDVYNSNDFGVEMKSDGDYVSPLTRADKVANQIITKGLLVISSYPIVSEESEIPKDIGSIFWLVDPLDGTKEFLKRNGEFTVNIGLIKDGKPVLGVVYVPVKDEMYCGDAEDSHAYKIEADGSQKDIFADAQKRLSKPVIVTSRSHIDDKTKELLKSIGEHDEISMGSSLKMCVIAEGLANLYPRLAPTYLWDTAAADAVLRAAGGSIKQLSGEPLVYVPSSDLKNPFFVVECADSNIKWGSYL